MKINNLSQLKKAIKIGTKLKVVYNDSACKLNGSVRAIDKVQSNAIRFENGSWLYWEKSSRYEFFDGGFSVFWDDERKNKIMDYYFVD